MNTASGAFRSHLMQQFAAAARTQSRPPLALSWGTLPPAAPRRSFGDEEDIADLSKRTLSSIATTHSRGVVESTTNHRTEASGRVVVCRPKTTVRLSSTVKTLDDRRLVAVSRDATVDDVTLEERAAQDALAHTDSAEETHVQLSSLFQDMIKTRRTVTIFAAPESSNANTFFWKEALRRSVECGLQAPNHKRTEPITFKRLVSPSSAIDALADIAANVQREKIRSKMEREPQEIREQQAAEAAAKKRDKWASIPAYLVTLVRAESTIVDAEELDMAHPYTPLPYVAPKSERELEDYAAGCAAIQNVMLSLHAEGIASKWATGPVISTPAFRKLVKAAPDERIVGLIMIGEPKLSRAPKLRRHHRSLENDELQDL